MTRQVGRNESCWCGSGKKYKRCHWNRENQSPIPVWSAADAFKAAHSQCLCLAPQNLASACSGKIVKAHTVPRSGSLKRIAKDGHVYGWSFSDLNKRANHQGIPQPTRIGLNIASTFMGFCDAHDNAIFKPVENEKFVFSPEQCFLLGYRALAYEKYMKDAQANSINIIRDVDKGWSLNHQISHQNGVALYTHGVTAGQRDIDEDKSFYDNVLTSEDYSSMRSYIVKFEKTPTIMCSGRLAPIYDFTGALLQDGCDPNVKLRHLSLNSFASGDGGAVVFTWLEDSDNVCVPFARSLHATDHAILADTLTRLMFENLQNIYWSPTWWDNLPDESKAALIKRFADATDLTKPIDPQALAPDGRSYNDWGNAEIQALGFELQ
ncbi:SEC-C motif-containing protein [Amphiplicatus metriothermophilus]|uniref:SEC-C motif-containing protein n=2 Tax=Amphiplicatus metriothermophilus TaxID=1519374 RepID=A0A239PMG2_9PROT|nr:SEC-C motif-containing protein [Amphiplicatus metriothermophilus]